VKSTITTINYLHHWRWHWDIGNKTLLRIINADDVLNDLDSYEMGKMMDFGQKYEGNKSSKSAGFPNNTRFINL
jgi:hypothetical protein